MPKVKSKDERAPHRVVEGDCLEVMPTMAANSVDAIATDPPYGLKFMGRAWDHGVPGVPFWEAALRVAKPGAHLLAFGGTRTFHRLACAIEDAGWEIRDTLMWVYGSGFPKSLDVSKAINKEAGAEREKVRVNNPRNPKATGGGRDGTPGATRPWIEEAMRVGYHEMDGEVPVTDAARQWQGWGTALKPAWEPIIMARKPLVGTVAANVLSHGTGALNIDGCRIGTEERWNESAGNAGKKSHTVTPAARASEISGRPAVGRWPANLAHDGSDEVLALFPSEAGGGGADRPRVPAASGGTALNLNTEGQLFANGVGFDDSGSAARFFYTAKASKADRGPSCTHPTVKPIDLMRWLVRLVTPPGGLILDPFCGSGSTGCAAVWEGFRFVGIEREAEYVEMARKRLHTEALLKKGDEPPPGVD